MATNTLTGLNVTFEIKNADGTSFHDLVMHKSTVESIVMSLGDKITGDVYYKDNTLSVTMQEYIEYNGVHYVLVSPPTVVREGMASDNSGLKGMTKYSFVFYHPMYMLGNFPFTDIAVTQDEAKFLSQNKTFSWIGNLFDMTAKLNTNLAATEWLVEVNIQQYEQDGTTLTQQWQKALQLSEVLTFDKQFVSDVLKTTYDQWEIPFTITSIDRTVNGVQKKFLVEFGLPSQEIYDTDGVTPYVFKFGQGVGLKNNSRTPRNNKIITRLSCFGSERNIPYGYPQIIWAGDQSWEYTINNDSTQPNSYPIYDGIVGGQRVRLIKHPFTRKTLMPTIYVDTVNRKINPLATGYDPDTVIIDYHDAGIDYPNPINPNAPSFETHQFEDVYPRLGDASIVAVKPYDDTEYISYDDFCSILQELESESANQKEIGILLYAMLSVLNGVEQINSSQNGGSYTYSLVGTKHIYGGGYWYDIKMTSDNINFKYNVYVGNTSPSMYVVWDDSMDDDGNYTQYYFRFVLPQLSFDLYACASITEKMDINMRSGACIGCTFPIQVDWDDYKANFFHSDGTFDPVIHTTEGDGHVRDGQKYPDSSQGQITVIVQKEYETFGVLMPNTYQLPNGETSTGAGDGDKFVILGISLPTSYITAAQLELDGDIDEYMLENNVHYYDYPLKFDEYFFAKNLNILSQIKNNSKLRFEYAGVENTLYIKQIVIKYGENVLPQYDITLTDDVEIVLNQIGQVTDDVSRIRVQMNELQKYYGEDVMNAIAEKLSKVVDDVCQGRITFQTGLNALGSVLLSDEIRSSEFTSGLYTGHGWRVDALGNAEFESLRVRSYLEIVQLIINRMQAQEGDTIYTDNDQIDKVEEKTYNGTTYYKLSLKEKWDGYVTSQKVDNILKGIINTLAAKQGQVSDVTESQSVETDGDNKYYTSWMKVINPSSVGDTVETNQICVILYGDSSVPAGKNFKPCELMTIARWGCDADPEASGLTPAQKADIERRQRIFSISTTDGRIAKLRGVRRPILDATNYGTTLGIVPDFINQWSIASRLIKGRDYLYAQGVIVGDFIKVDALGNPQTNYVDCGDWQDNTPYLHEAYNSTTLQWETNDVWHNGSYWRCKVTQPYQGTYYEPTDANSLYWEKLLTSGQDGNDGDTIRTAQVFIAKPKPERPTGSALPPTGWSLTPPTFVKSFVDGENGERVAYGNGVNNLFVAERLVINVPSADTGVTIALRASTEEDDSDYYDYIAVGNADTEVTEDNVDDLPDSRKAAGTETKDVRVTFSTTGLHFVDVVFKKDYSVSGNDDCVFYKATLDSGVTMTVYPNRVWTSFGTLKNNVLQGTWSSPVTFNGEDGKDGADGQDGESAASAFASPDKISIQCGITGNVLSSLSKDVTFSLKVGSNNATVTGVSSGTKPTGVTVTGRANNVVTIAIGTTATASGMAAGVTFTVTGRYEGKTYTASITVALIGSLKGNQGDRGKTGRFFYYADVFDSSNNTDTFTATDTEAPFFKYNGNYWVYVGDNFSNKTMQWLYNNKGGYPSSSNSNYELMVTDFKYLITEAIFASFAKLGSFIISGDFFVSQYGILVSHNGTETTIDASNYQSSFGGKVPYAWFSADDPMAEGSFDSGYRFRPSKCMNALTGEEYFAKGNVRISADGDIRMNGALMCSKLVRTIPSASVFNLFTGNTAATLKLKADNLLLYGNYSSNAQIQLPPAKFFVGAKIKIQNGTYTNKQSNPSILNLSVYHSQETEANVEDAYNVSLNSLAIASPIKNPNTGDLFYYDYYTTLNISDYATLELMSVQNFFNGESSPYYVWMVVDGREAI